MESSEKRGAAGRVSEELFAEEDAAEISQYVAKKHNTLLACWEGMPKPLSRPFFR
jgi:hypothetical protein